MVAARCKRQHVHSLPFGRLLDAFAEGGMLLRFECRLRLLNRIKSRVGDPSRLRSIAIAPPAVPGVWVDQGRSAVVSRTLWTPHCLGLHGSEAAHLV